MDIKDKRIVVTGGDGFLGRHLIARLEQEGCRHLFIPKINEYDLTKEENVIRVYRDFNPEIVINLAAVVGGIEANRLHPGKFYYENAIMGLHIIENARTFGVEKFVQLGSICSYPKFTPTPFQEDDLWNGYPEETNAPYGIAKKSMLIQLQGYRQEYGFNGVFLMPVNLYGPGDNFDPEMSHVIPGLIGKFIKARNNEDKEVVVWGDGSPTREFLYVKDAAEAIALATKLYDEPDPVNLGSGQEISIKKLVYLIKDIVGYNGKVVWDTTRPNGQPRRTLDTSRAENKFGFKAQISLVDGIRATVEWFEQQ